MEVINLKICQDCADFQFSGDLSFLSLLDEETEVAREKEIIEGDNRLVSDGISITGLGDTEEFSIDQCESCLTKLAGKRVKAVAIKNKVD
ncbi:MAG: hypothetical protein MK175_20165 [Pseudoalteromonas sp.]|uniref:hypothetical protein n=1 Tax=Pseudoalteromonas sp. TaxID=53249 RepID=UPI0025D717C5|nr:hypothetical protein [Pseudoalteromonas sp.]MCH2089504.1 hypothetical protein [Pseudoalteromonas sp.]